MPLLAVLLLQSCRAEAVNLDVSCEATVEETVENSYALAYGSDLIPPTVENTFPITEQTLSGVSMKDPVALGLLAVNSAGDTFQRTCDARPCSTEDAVATFKLCRETAGCQLVGATKDRSFHPFYEFDRTGGHICKVDI